MLISPPFLLPRQANETDDAWIDRCMQGGRPGDGAFPLSLNLGWHGGMHLVAPTDGPQPGPVRAIADGTVVFSRNPTPQPAGALDEQSMPLAYRGKWTDNGVVVLRHETEIGQGVHGQVTFFSIYMHLSALHAAVGTTGRTVHRKAELGTAGQIYGEQQRAIHFEIVCDDANLRALVGRSAGELDTSADGRLDAVYGQMHFLLPGGTQFFAQKPLDHLPAAHIQPPQPRRNAPVPPIEALEAAYTSAADTPLVVTLRYSTGEGGEGHRGSAYLGTLRPDGTSLGAPLEEPNGEYNLYTRANEISSAYPADARPAPSAVFELLRFGRVVNTDNETLTPADVPHWREVRYPGGQGWVNLNAAGVRKYSDADFPHWQQWRLIDDSADQDSRCDSPTLKGWLDVTGDGQVDPIEATARLADSQLATQLARAICKFPTEWDKATVDQRWGWLKTSTVENPNPFTDKDFALLKAHIEALAFFPGGTGLPAAHWHFEPREFFRQFRRCLWLSCDELARTYPDSNYPTQALATEGRGRTPASIREQYRIPVNRTIAKYFLTNPIRLTHFLGQGAVESMTLALMIEGSADYRRNPAHASYRPENAGYYVPQRSTDYLFYLENRLGNIHAGDGPKFRGRGMKQLTGMENYSKYWVYRGWLNSESFQTPWWDPSRPDRAPDIRDPQRISTNDHNAVDAGGWYWNSGSASNRFQTINTIISTAAIDRTAVFAVSRAINGINRKTGEPNGLAARLAATSSIAEIIMDNP